MWTNPLHLQSYSGCLAYDERAYTYKAVHPLIFAWGSDHLSNLKWLQVRFGDLMHVIIGGLVTEYRVFVDWNFVPSLVAFRRTYSYFPNCPGRMKEWSSAFWSCMRHTITKLKIIPLDSYGFRSTFVIFLHVVSGADVTQSSILEFSSIVNDSTWGLLVMYI